MATLHGKEEMDFQQQWNDLDPYPLVGTAIIYTEVIRNHIIMSDWDDIGPDTESDGMPGMQPVE